MAKGFSTEQTETQQPQKVDYQGKTSQGYAEFAAQKSVEERFKLADAIAREGAGEIIQDVAFLESRYVQKALADGTVTNLVMGHLAIGNTAQTEARNTAYEAIDRAFAGGEISAENFTSILSGSTSQLQLKGA